MAKVTKMTESVRGPDSSAFEKAVQSLFGRPWLERPWLERPCHAVHIVAAACAVTEGACCPSISAMGIIWIDGLRVIARCKSLQKCYRFPTTSCHDRFPTTSCRDRFPTIARDTATFIVPPRLVALPEIPCSRISHIVTHQEILAGCCEQLYTIYFVPFHSIRAISFHSIPFTLLL